MGGLSLLPRSDDDRPCQVIVKSDNVECRVALSLARRWSSLGAVDCVVTYKSGASLA